MSLRQIKQAARALSLVKLKKLDEWLHAQIRALEETDQRAAERRREVIKERVIDRKTYRRVGVRCGKEGCKCADGELHGHYWYAWWSEGGRTKSQYVGKRLPKSEGEVKQGRRS